MELKIVFFFSESGLIIESDKLGSNEDGYVVLATIYKDQKIVNQENSFKENGYNSKRLFGNMMESFRRDIGENRNSLEKKS